MGPQWTSYVLKVSGSIVRPCSGLLLRQTGSVCYLIRIMSCALETFQEPNFEGPLTSLRGSLYLFSSQVLVLNRRN